MQGAKALSDAWVGKTVFYVLRRPPPKGHEWIYGRLTKIQETTRPGNLWPEVWQVMSKSQKRRAREKWTIISQKLKEAREERGLFFIPKEDKDYELSLIHI